MTKVLELTPKDIDRLVRRHIDYATLRPAKYIAAIIKVPGATLTVYESGKVLIQGADAKLVEDDIRRFLGLGTDEKPDYFSESIGSDESGVGDYFGPLTACAAYVRSRDGAFLKSLSLRDSKTLTDEQILRIAPRIAKRIPHSSLVLDNEKYNVLIESGFNAHKLKAYLHAQCHKRLLEKTGKRPPIVVDAFCAERHYRRYLEAFEDAPVPDVFVTKAESVYASVAAASIIARHRFLSRLAALSEDIGETLHKGASEKVDAQAKRLFNRHGEKALMRFAKMHFKTTKKVRDPEQE